MGGSDSAAVVEVQKELRGRIFDRYDKKASALNTLMTTLIAFAILFFAFILMPYVTLEHQKHWIDLQIAEIKENIARQSASVAAQKAALQANKESLQQSWHALEELHAKQFDTEEVRAQRTAALQERQAKLAAATDAAAKATESLNGLQKVQADIAGLKLKTDANVAELRSYLSELASQYQSGAVHATAECSQADRWAQTRCRVHMKVKAQIDRAFESVDKIVLKPLADVDKPLADRAKERLAALREDFDRRLFQNPDFWQSLDEKTLFYGGLEQEFGKFTDEIVAVINEDSGGLQDKLTEFSGDVGRLETERAQAEAQVDALKLEAEGLRKNADRLESDIAAKGAEIAAAGTGLGSRSAELEKATKALDEARAAAEADRKAISDTEGEIAQRLSSVQSPLGTLPIGLTEATLAFPVIVAVALLIASLMLVDALRLRGAFHALWRRLDPDERVLGEKEMAMIAPLWLDPASSGPKRFLAGIAFLLPVLIFVAAVALIAYSWTITDKLPVGGRTTLGAFAVFYAVGSLMILLGMEQLRKAWRSYDRPAPSVTMPHAS